MRSDLILLLPLIFGTRQSDEILGGVTCQEEGEEWNVWEESKQKAEALFYQQADFGFLETRLYDMKTLCEGKSKLKCSKDLEFCVGTNIRINFRHLKERIRTENLRYKMDLFSPGDIGLMGCEMNRTLLESQLGLMSPLQSWAPELRNLDVVDEECDITISDPTYIMKLDATVNMYHHFCDFFNLFLSLHMNNSLSDNNHKQILVLDNYRYSSSFGPTWEAFTSLPVWNLEQVAGKSVCFDQAMFPLLPRMVHGLYYNTPLVAGCSNSSMFLAFSKFILDRLHIPVHNLTPKLRVTLLSRDTSYRRITNEQDVVTALEATDNYEVRLARFSPSFPFASQLEVISNTDILLGVHGAGLTHLLFLPVWGEVIELYNCGDKDCYKDLARLRGVGYTTWENEDLITRVEVNLGGPYETGPAHKKFANYKFDTREVVRLVGDVRDKILANKLFQTDKNVHEEL